MSQNQFVLRFPMSRRETPSRDRALACANAPALCCGLNRSQMRVESLAAPMSGWVHRVGGAEDVAVAAEAAYRACLSPPRVATLILPADSAWGEVNAKRRTRVLAQ